MSGNNFRQEEDVVTLRRTEEPGMSGLLGNSAAVGLWSGYVFVGAYVRSAVIAAVAVKVIEGGTGAGSRILAVMGS